MSCMFTVIYYASPILPGFPLLQKKIRNLDNQLVGLSDIIRRNEPPMGSGLWMDEVDRTDTKIVHSMTTILR